ncbi:MAG: 3-oxoacyl-ACP reductase FabG [Gammaproteobacteria bacterium]
MSEQKLALVTGASRGIGLAIAMRLAADGYDIIGTATGASGVAAIEQALGAGGRLRAALALDVTDKASLAAFFEALERDALTPSVLVNNAGVTRDNLLLRMKDDEWETVIAANLDAVFALTRRLLRAMVKARYGRIISITSVVGVSGNGGQANYAAAKAGVIGFSKSLAQEVANRGITVNAVAPGFIDTDMTRKLSEAQKSAALARVPMGRMGTSEEIAATVAFLASDGAAYITGETIHVNGGMYMA